MAKTDYVFRYVAVRGVEYREWFSGVWYHATPNFIASLSSSDLRAVADAMDNSPREFTSNQIAQGILNERN